MENPFPHRWWYNMLQAGEFKDDHDYFPNVANPDLRRDATEILKELSDMGEHARRLFSGWRFVWRTLGDGRGNERYKEEESAYRFMLKALIGDEKLQILEIALIRNDVDYEQEGLRSTIVNS